MSNETHISAKGMIKLAGRNAYAFDREPRKKCRQFLNIIFGMAKANGYENELKFRNHYKGRSNDRENEDRLVKELLGFLSANEIDTAFDYLRDD